MTTTPQPHHAHKPSGVPWLGDVPVHWEVVQLGRIGIFSKGSGGTKDDEVPDGIPCVRYGDLYTTHTHFIRRTRSYVSPARASAYTPINRGDVLFPTSGETIEDIGKSAVNLMHTQVLCGGDLIIFRSTIPMEPKFAGYALDCNSAQTQKSLMGRGITIMHVYSAQLKYLRLPLPPLSEQAAIVHYLDHVDRRIRRYVGAKQRLVALLEEEKQAVVNQAVTRGLDPTVRLKPSGIEWLGDVPEHWEVKRLGNLLQERGEINADGHIEEVLSVLRNRGVIPYADKGNIGNKKSEDITRYKIVRPDDIVINCMNVIIGSVGLSTYTGCLSPVYYVLTRRSRDDDTQYLNAYFQTKPFQQSLVRIGNGILAHRMRIPMELLKCEPFPRPPAEEQAVIVEYIAMATADIDTATARARRQIALVQEYRTRLIVEVVTGKLDVREAAAQLFDETDDQDPMEEGDLLTD